MYLQLLELYDGLEIWKNVFASLNLVFSVYKIRKYQNILSHVIISKSKYSLQDNLKYKEIMQKFEHLLTQLREIAQQALTNWAENLQSQIENSLKVSILIQNPKSRELHLNFNPHLSAILREVHYLKLMEVPNIPEDALKLAEKNETFRTYLVNLNSTITWYNKIRRTTKPVEFDLIKNEICQIDKMVNLGQNNLNWNSEGKRLVYDKKMIFQCILN